MENEIVKRDTTELVAETKVFQSYLEKFGLPTDNIIATTEERKIIGSNLSNFMQTLSPEEKRDARYLSKFVGATAIGLFDAGLNYVWNEVVLNLRRKAIVYGVDIFFDAAVGGGLKSRDGKLLTWFSVAGADRKFVDAVAEIDGDTILVSSDKVTNPVAVRFGWSNLAEPNLSNKEGLPASPFRTDRW